MITYLFLSHPFMGILFILLIVVTVSFFHFQITSCIRATQASRFFAEHDLTCGIVRKYEKDDETYGSMSRPAFWSKTMKFVSHISYTPAQYYVYLECQSGEKRFCTLYQIPEEDYNAAAVGASVQIKDEWEPEGYELL